MQYFITLLVTLALAGNDQCLRDLPTISPFIDGKSVQGTVSPVLRNITPSAMESQQQNPNTERSTYDEEFKKLSFSSLTDLELDALNSLDESIRCHETTDIEEVNFDNKVEQLERRNTVTFQKSSKQATDSTKASHHRKFNTGYILFDGAEIKYISTEESEPELLPKPSEQAYVDGSSSQSSTHISELPSHLNLSSDDLIMRDSFKDTVSRISLTPHKRLPTYVHFTTMQKLYLFFVGAVPVMAVNAFYISIAFLLPILGKDSLSQIGKWIKNHL